MPTPTSIHRLAASLEPGPGEVIAFVGGGGKTTALFALGRQLSGRVVLSTTTKMGSDRRGGYSPLIGPSAAEVETVLATDRTLLSWSGIEDHRALGFTAGECMELFASADYLVLEADGSRRRPFKAPASHEPVVPAETTMLVACVGAAAFDAVIADTCHRPEVVAEIADCAVTERLDPARLARVLRSDVGSQKGCPPGARYVVLLNQVTTAHADYVDALADELRGMAPIVAIEPFAPADSPERERSNQ